MGITNVIILVSLVSSALSQDSYGMSDTLQLGLSPFAAEVYQLALNSGLFNKIFEIPIPAQPETRIGFEQEDLNMIRPYGISATDPSLPPIWTTSYDLLTKNLKPLDFFKIMISLLENELDRKGVAAAKDNPRVLAESLHKTMLEAVDSDVSASDPLSVFHALNIGSLSFLHNLGIYYTPDDVLLMLRNADEMMKDINMRM